MPDLSSAKPGIGWGRRFRAFWPLKLGLTAVVNIVFWGFYFFLSRHAFFPVRTLPLTPLDRWAGFRPQPWVWVYESVFVLTGAVPWLIDLRADLWRYLKGFGLLAGASFLIFALFPVAAPRPVDLGSNQFLLLITRLDGPLNAFPSLHAGSLVYTLALARHLFGRTMGHAAAAALVLWAVLILFATLATKQHYALDLVAGGVLGWAADWFAWRRSAAETLATDSTRQKIAPAPKEAG